jgi:hypothetical protein
MIEMCRYLWNTINDFLSALWQESFRPFERWFARNAESTSAFENAAGGRSCDKDVAHAIALVSRAIE